MAGSRLRRPSAAENAGGDGDRHQPDRGRGQRVSAPRGILFGTHGGACVAGSCAGEADLSADGSERDHRGRGLAAGFPCIPFGTDRRPVLFTANLIILDEWAFQQYAEEIWTSGFPTVNRPGGGQVIGLSTMRLGTLFARLWQEGDAFHRIFLPWDTETRGGMGNGMKRRGGWKAATPDFAGMTPFIYSLLPETADCSTGNAEDLGHTPNIALEVLNDGPQFYGLDGNLVPEGGTFYLVGKLTYKKDNSKSEVVRVFQQDYNTTANLSINSLAKAYNTVPDLINPRLELALAVDIDWKAGLVIDVPIGD